MPLQSIWESATPLCANYTCITVKKINKVTII